MLAALDEGVGNVTAALEAKGTFEEILIVHSMLSLRNRIWRNSDKLGSFKQRLWKASGVSLRNGTIPTSPQGFSRDVLGDTW